MASAKTPRKTLKKPTGEFSKSNSALAKFIDSIKDDNLNAAQSRIAAGKYRDMEKAMGGFGKFGVMDKSGATLGKAIKKTQAQSARADKAKQDAMRKKKLAKALGATPVGMGLKVAGKAAGMYAKAGKAVAKTVKDKMAPQTKGKQQFPGQKKGGANATPRGMKSGGKALTPAQKAALKKMLSQGGRLDK